MSSKPSSGTPTTAAEASRQFEKKRAGFAMGSVLRSVDADRIDTTRRDSFADGGGM
jgi:hypothetical protein